MKNKNNISIICLAICVLLGINTVKGQVQNYKLGEIENWESFMILSEMEKERIEIEEQHKKLTDHLYSVDSMFIEGTPDSLKNEYYKREIERRKNFEFNRSRWDIKSFANNKVQDSTLIEGSLISLDCNCILKDNQVQIFMGMWVFGGTFVNIEIEKESFSATFIEDAHKLKPYKYTIQDSILVNELELVIDKKNLTLINKPKFQLHELIAGMIEFETPIYYTDSQYNYGLAGGTGESMDEMKTKGKVYFTCELKKKENY